MASVAAQHNNSRCNHCHAARGGIPGGRLSLMQGLEKGAKKTSHFSVTILTRRVVEFVQDFFLVVPFFKTFWFHIFVLVFFVF